MLRDMIKKLDWDSDFFELQIGEVNVEDTRFPLEDASYDLLYVRSNSDVAPYIEGYKNTFSERILIYTREIKSDVIDTLNEYILPFNEDDFSLSELYELAYIGGRYSRFHLDEEFDNQKFRNLYRKWIDNSLNKSNGDELLVYQENGQLMGFVVYSVNHDYATYRLLAVSPNFQGKGIAKKLLEFVAGKLSLVSINKLVIPTQKSNEVACGLYEKLGYKISEEKYIKHYWKI